MTPPRIIKTHLPSQLVPPAFWENKCKVSLQQTQWYEQPNNAVRVAIPCCPSCYCCCKSPLYVPSDLVQRPSMWHATPKTTWWATSSLTWWIRPNLNPGRGTATSASSSRESVSWPCQVFVLKYLFRSVSILSSTLLSFSCQHLTSHFCKDVHNNSGCCCCCCCFLWKTDHKNEYLACPSSETVFHNSWFTE